MISEASNIHRSLFLILFALLWGCSQPQTPSHIVGKTMGTTYSIKYLGATKTPPISSLNQEIVKLLLEINRQMSTYISSSEISVFNTSVKKNTPYKISEDFYKTLSLSLDIAEKTSGQFDPTIGPLVNLWGFGPDGVRKKPEAQDIEAAKKRVGHKKLILGNGEISKTIDDLYLDLSASAKGYGVDKVAELLESHSVANYMVEIGGEVRTKGSKGGEMWKIAIESPHPEDPTRPYQRILNLKTQAVATSGNYRNFFEEGGKKYSHTMDYRTGRPAEHTLASVTVIHHNSCAAADAWATALMVMGPVQGLEFAEKNGISAYFIYRASGQTSHGFVEVESSHFKKSLGL